MNPHESDGILFHSFLGDAVLAINNIKAVEIENFKTSFLHNTTNSTKKEDYLNQFNTLKSQIKKGIFEKLILSRIKQIPSKSDPISIFEKLNIKYLNTFNYIISNPEIGTWMGATPERLLSTNETILNTVSLAGTKIPADNWTTKELEEQDLVTKTIRKNLQKTNCTDITEEGPKTITAGKIEHLQTKIAAQMESPGNWTNVLNALHPTPAVCGLPTQAARDYIPLLEKHDRKFYTGFIGIINKGQKDFFVNLRCMELAENFANLYVGGGIIAASDGESEWLETERKAETLASILS